MERQRARNEFTAVIEGIELPPEAVDGLTRAVQKAVLTELANTDLQGSLKLRIPSEEDRISGDTTNGIWVVPEER
jgi:hypothetical protein